MKFHTKANDKLLSPRRSVIEQLRLRQSFERRLYSQLLTFFASVGQTASQEVITGQIRLLQLENQLSQILLPHYRAVINTMASRFVFVKEETDFERFVRQYIALHAGIKITQISNTTRSIINKIILDSELEGIGVQETATRIIERTKPSFTRVRSALIARTETHMASSFANQVMAESFNVPMQKRWVSVNDNRTRKHHRAMNGTTIDIEDDFIIFYNGVEYRMKHAGDPRGGPANIINCRCVILYLEPEDKIVGE